MYVGIFNDGLISDAYPLMCMLRQYNHFRIKKLYCVVEFISAKDLDHKILEALRRMRRGAA